MKCRALLELPPTGLPPIVEKKTGGVCFKIVHPVLASKPGWLSPPVFIGNLTIFTSEISYADREVEKACSVIRKEERGRGERTILLGERNISLARPLNGGECSGAFLYFGHGNTKKLL